MITYWSDIRAAAVSHDLDPKLVAALVLVESGGNTWAWNPEPRYHYFWDVKNGKPYRALTSDEITSELPPSDFHSLAGDPDQEWWGQQASWGLMQVMGAVARELGFVGPYLTELGDPVKNLVIGCKKLEHLMNWSKGNTTQALAAYNGGQGNNEVQPFRNQSYADKILYQMTVLEV